MRYWPTWFQNSMEYKGVHLMCGLYESCLLLATFELIARIEAKLQNWMLDHENQEHLWSDTWHLCSFLRPELCDFDVEVYQFLCFLMMFCCVGNLTVWEDQVASLPGSCLVTTFIVGGLSQAM